MNLGIQPILSVNLGGASISKVYLGPALVWSAVVSYTAEVDPGDSAGTKIFNGITGWTPDAPFLYPTAGGGPIQTRNANDPSPITIVAGYNNSAKASGVILIKNGIIQQTIGVTGASPPRVFNPLTITDGDVVKVQGA